MGELDFFFSPRVQHGSVSRMKKRLLIAISVEFVTGAYCGIKTKNTTVNENGKTEHTMTRMGEGDL